jgi:hypothetical protein
MFRPVGLLLFDRGLSGYLCRDWLAPSQSEVAMTTPDYTATTWRDLADQLTPEQIARFERVEQLCRSKAHLAFPQNNLSETIAHLLAGVLKVARWQAQQNLSDEHPFGQGG